MSFLYRLSTLLFWGCITVFPLLTKAQSVEDSVSVEVLLESYLSFFSDEQDIDEEWLADLQFLLLHPINLNHSDVATLTRVPFIDRIFASTIIAYRDSAGGFGHLSDLKKIRHLSESEFERIVPFLRVHPPENKNQPVQKPPAKAPSITLVQSYSRRLDLTAGFRLPPDQGGFLGTPAAIYSRFSANLNDHISLRLTSEKDPGEAFNWNPSTNSYGFDHITGSIQYNNSRLIQQLIIGDFTVMTGQGLLFWRNTSRGKGTLPLEDPIKSNVGVKPIASREENAFFRGSAISVHPFKNAYLDVFYSNRTLDASLNRGPDTLQLYLSALNKTGLHRTTSELSRKDSFTEQLLGGSAAYRSSRVSIGVSGYLSAFSHPYKKGEGPDDFFDFAGKNLSGVSLHGKLRSRIAFAFMELAQSFPGGGAIISGLLFSPHQRFRALFLWRHFGRDYHAFHSAAFAEQRSVSRNEEGFYAAVQLNLNSEWTTSFFVDFYRHPWLKTNINHPTSGLEYFASLTYAPRTWMRTSMHYRYEQQEEGIQSLNNFGQVLKSTTTLKKHAVRFQGDYTFSKQLRLRSRIDTRVKQSIKGRLFGAMIQQDIVWSPVQNTQIYLRISMFDSDGGGATLYAYENDLRYRFTIRSFTGNGARNFLLLRTHVGAHLTLEAKYSTTRYGQITNKGAGADSFSGTLVREIQTQIIWHV